MSDTNLNVKITADNSSLKTAMNESTNILNTNAKNMQNTTSGLGNAFKGLSNVLSGLKQSFSNLGSGMSSSVAPTQNLNSSLTGLNATMGKTATETQKASAGVKDFGNNLGQAKTPNEGFTNSLNSLSAAFVGLYSAQKVVQFINDSKTAVVQAESSFRGLEAIVNNSGQSMSAAMQVVARTTQDGLLSTAEASKSLQNLLSRGYNLDQAEQTLLRLKDAAAFNRQANLSLGEAVQTATEGLKNENSVLVDNAGVTKNVAKMWQEYADKIGVGYNELTQAQKITAEYNGILKETEAQIGNAAKASEGFQGNQARLNTEFTQLKETVGQALMPIFNFLTKVLTDMAEKFNMTIKFVQSFGAVIAYAGQMTTAFFKAITTGSFDRFKTEVEQANQVLKEYYQNLYANKGATFASSGGPVAQPGGQTNSVEENNKDALKSAENTSRLVIEKAKQEADTKSTLYKADLDRLKLQLNKKLISYQEYASKAIELEKKIADSQKGFFETKIAQFQTLMGMNPAKDQAVSLQVEMEKAKGEIARLEIEANKRTDVIRGGGGISGGGGRGRRGPTQLDIQQAGFELTKTQLEVELALYQANKNAKVAVIEDQFSRFKISAQQYYAELDRLNNEEAAKKKQIVEAQIAQLKNLKPENEVDRIKIKQDQIKLESELKIIEAERAEGVLENARKLNVENEERKKSIELRKLERENSNFVAAEDMKSISLDQEFALRKINNEKMIQLDLDKEKRLFENSLNYLEQKKALYEGDVEQQEQINEQIENAKLEHTKRMAQMNKDLVLEQKKDYISLFNTTENSLANFFSSVSKQPRKIKDAFTDLFTSIADQMVKLAAQKYANQIMESSGIQDFLMSMTSSGGGMSMGSSGGGIGGGLIGGLMNAGSSMFSGLMNMLPSFDVGTNNVPKDMIAKIHKGEKIVPARYNNEQSMSKNVSVNNQFILSGPVDRRTQMQIAQTAGNSVKAASMKNG